MSDNALKNLFLWPTLGILIAINLFPLFYSLYLSFTNFSAIANKPPVWIGFQNFNDILSNGTLWRYFQNTGKYVVLTVVLEMILGFSLAMLLRRQFWGSGVVTTLILVPMMLSPVVVGLFWKLIYNPNYGIFNYLIPFANLGELFKNGYDPNLGIMHYLIGFLPGKGPDWLANGKTVMWAVVITDVWMWSPFVMLLCTAGLSAIPDYIYEAADIDRAKPLYQFWRITLPQVAPLLLVAVLFRTIEAVKTFDLVMGMTGGGPGDATELIAVNLYRMAFLGQFDTGRASALAYIMLIIIVAAANIYIKYLNKVKEG